ncbi:hypothetical protein JCM33374_g1117 [Metschnikowia sp. JCM 33374]|nr:hypothetical protein JCM33374_g1117 [Metschnikowia sp. JCM 33374]
MLDIINSSDNANKCGECGADFPTWASRNLGILLCGRCANSHRKVLSVSSPRGGPISQVKSLTLEKWSDDEIDRLRQVGNKTASERWNPKQVPFPYDDDDDAPMEEFLRDKYIHGRFRWASVNAEDYDNGSSSPVGRSRSVSSLQKQPSSRSRAGSVKVPRLSHRKPTSYEQRKFSAQAKKIASYGFSDVDAVFESLVLSDGDVDLALDILDHDSKVNPSMAELPPSLPRRPPTSSAQTTGATSVQAADTPATSAGSDWWTGQTQPPQATTTNAQATGYLVEQPQIYQYTDPVTGQVSYVDANGQQYLDPNNPQHQQLLVQQTNPQYLSQQATKQNIMSLYNQPEQYATNVAAPSTAQQQQQQQQQLQQQQLQQQQLQQQQLQQQQLQQQYTLQMQATQQQHNGVVYPGGQFYSQAAPQQGVPPQQYGQPQQFWR